MSAEQIENWSQMEVIYNLKMKSPGSIPVLCSDMSLEDTDNEILTNVMPKRVIVDTTYMRERDQENKSSPQKEDYDNCIIDKKAFVNGAKDFKQTCDKLNLPFREKDCFRHTTVHYCTSSDYEDELYRQLINLHEQREIKAFNYSFNKQIYSGCQNIRFLKGKVRFGGFGKVCPYQDIQTGWTLAIKKVEEVKKKHLQLNEIKVPIQFPNEINIARVLGCFFDGLDFYIIQEHAGKALLEADEKEFAFFRQPNNSLTFAFQLFTGLNVLSQHGITHCDVKPHNVCFSDIDKGSFLVKLIDFGSCQTKKDPVSFSGLTQEYLPPDFNKVYFNKRLASHRDKRGCNEDLRSLNEKDDIWAAGLTLLYIYKENHPMCQYFDEQLVKFSDLEKTEKRLENIRLIGGLTDPLDDYFTTKCAALDYILRCILVVNSDLRWTASPILNYLQDQLDRSFMDAEMSEPCDDFIDIKKGNGQHKPIISDIGNIPVEEGAQYFGLIMKSKKKYDTDKISDRAMRQNPPGVGKYSHCAVVQETNQQEAMEYSLQREQFVFPPYQPQYQSEHQPSNQLSSPIRECLPVTQALAVKANNIPRFDLLLGDSNLF